MIPTTMMRRRTKAQVATSDNTASPKRKTTSAPVKKIFDSKKVENAALYVDFAQSEAKDMDRTQTAVV